LAARWGGAALAVAAVNSQPGPRRGHDRLFIPARIIDWRPNTRTCLALVGAGFASTWITRWRRHRRSIAAGEPATEGTAG
jgi:hypothetical protein